MCGLGRWRGALLGRNTRGELGIGSTANIGDDPGEMPPAPIDLGGPVAMLATGDMHSCALLDSGEVRCWGHNSAGQLGQGHDDNIGDEPNEMPPPIVDVGPGNVVKIAAGGSHTCVLLDTNKLRCWGTGNAEHRDDTPGEMPPPDVDVGPGTITDFGMMTYGTCALFDNGDLRCWGYNGEGALGIGTNMNVGDGPGEMPPANGAIGGAAIAISRGSPSTRHTCVMLQDWTLRCWGQNSTGQLGYGNTMQIGDHGNEMPPAPVQAF